MTIKIKVFECAICKQMFFNNVKGETRFIGTRKDVRYHLRKIHHVNRQAGVPKHKGLRVHIEKSPTGDKIKDERSRVTQNCILYKEF
jgi:hypothetical protein